MSCEETTLKPKDSLNSGGVTRFTLPDNKTTITRISTFCPDEIGPGPTHTYLVDSDAQVLVDSGIPTAIAKAFFYAWRGQAIPPEVEVLPPDHSEQEFRQGLGLVGRSISDLDLLVFSHGHLDHFMMARTLFKDARVSVSAHILDTPHICNPWALLNMWVYRTGQMAATGMPPAMSARHFSKDDQVLGFDLESLGVDIKVDAPLFGDGPLKVNGTALSNVNVAHIPGHSPGSVGLIVGEGNQKVLICGDVLLNPITPHPDDLLEYLRTLEKLGDRDDIALTLPAHGKEIRDLRERVEFLKEHHRNRLWLTFEACAHEKRVWDIATMPGYFDTFVDRARFNFLAGLEALVHMELLNMVDGLKRTNIRNGVHYFRKTDEGFDEVYGRITELVRSEQLVTLMRY